MGSCPPKGGSGYGIYGINGIKVAPIKVAPTKVLPIRVAPIKVVRVEVMYNVVP